MTPIRTAIVLVLFAVATSKLAGADPIGIEVHAIGNCPSSEAVNAELGRIAASDETLSDRGRADVFESPRGVRVRFVPPGGGSGAERAIETSADCEERAIAAAVVIASWQADLRAEVQLDLGAVSAGTGRASSWSPSAGIAGVGAASGTGGWAAGGAVDLQMAHRTGWGGRIAAWGTSYRSSALGTKGGQASWTRWVLGIGPVYELARGPAVLAATAQLAIARLAVRGEDFDTVQRDAGWDVGARLGIEAGFRWGALVPCAGIAVAGWPRSHHIKALGVDDEKTLPKLDLLLAAGMRWVRGP